MLNRLVINPLIRLLFVLVFDTMIAMLWAQRIMNGKKTFADVPRLLKEQVKEILIESGVEELVTE